MNIEHLKTFREIARLGSFSEVAKKLHISQPAVSFQIQRLEQEIGMGLIDRSQRTLQLTEAGKKLLRFAEATGGELERLQRELEKMREDVSGDLTVTASTIPGEYLLPPLLSRFKDRHPAINIRVEVTDSLTVIERVRDNTYETGFCGIQPEGRDLEYFKVAEDEIVLIAHRTNPMAGKSEIRPEELAGEPFIFREATSGTQKSLEHLLGQAGVDTGKLIAHLVLGSTQAVINAVAAKAGVAFISSLAVNAGYSPEIRRIKVRGLQLNRDFFCIYRRDRAPSRAAEEFRSFIKIETSQNGK